MNNDRTPPYLRILCEMPASGPRYPAWIVDRHVEALSGWVARAAPVFVVWEPSAERRDSDRRRKEAQALAAAIDALGYRVIVERQG